MKSLWVDARVFRISFTGELSYEINVLQDMDYMFGGINEDGKEYDITPYGTEAMRLES